MSSILLVEDEYDLGRLLKDFLQQSGYKVSWTMHPAEALELLKEKKYHLAILDVMLPGMSGYTLAESLNVLYPKLSFIFLTALNHKSDRLKGLKLNAIDFISKPFEPDELLLKINNYLTKLNTEAAFKKDKPENIFLDEDNLKVTILNQTTALTLYETKLLAYFLENHNQLLERKELLNAVWNKDDYFTGRSMDVFISRLRKLIALANYTIENKRSYGYRFCKIG